jgi:hypothetical protein
VTQEPKQEPAHLKDHRAVISFRSALVGAASLLPVPGVAEALAGALRRGLMRHVTSLRHVDIEDEAVDALLAEAPGPRRFTVYSALSGAVAFLKPRRALRRMVAALQILHGIEEGVRMFQLATLVDHYCTMHHLGPSIGVDKARRLRRVIDESTITAQRELAAEAINQIATQAGRILVELPGWAWGHIKRTGEPPALPSLAGLSRTTHELIANLSVRRYLGRLTETFDRKWSGGTVITVN